MAKQNKGRKFFAASATAALVASAVVPVASAAYNDESKIASWAKESVQYVTDAGYMQGSAGNFNPTGTFTRAEAATVATKVLGLDTSKTEYTKSFTDVKEGQWFFEEVGAAAEAGIISGLGDGTFNPNGKLSRQDAAIILAKIYNLDVASADVTVLDAFTDKGSIASYATKHLAALVEAGVIKGDNGKINPAGDIKRQELAVMLAKADVAFAEEVTIEEAIEGLDLAIKELPAVDSITIDNVEEAQKKVDEAKKAIEIAEKALAELKEGAKVDIAAIEKQIADAKAAVAELQAAIDKIVGSVEAVTVKTVNGVKNTKTFDVTLEKAVEGLTTSAFEVEVTVDSKTTTAQVVKVTANDDNTVYTVELENDLYLSKGAVSINGVEKEFDYSKTAEEQAITAIQSASDEEEILAALNAPILSLVNVNEALANEYLLNKNNFANNRADVQKNIVDYTNAEFNESISAALEEITTAVADYKKAVNDSQVQSALKALDEQLDALPGLNDYASFHDGSDFEDVSYDGDDAESEAKFEGKTVGLIYADYLANVSDKLELKHVQAAVDYLNGLLKVKNDIEKVITVYEGESTNTEKAVAVITEYYKAVDAVDNMVVGAGQKALQTKLEGTYTAIKTVIETEIEALQSATATLESISQITSAQEAYDKVEPLVNALRSSDDKTEFTKTLTSENQKIATASKGLIDAVNAKVKSPGVSNADLIAALGNVGITADEAQSTVIAKAATVNKVTFTTIKQIEEAFEEAKIVAPVNTALTKSGKDSIEAALDGLSYSAFINLGSTKRGEVALTFFLTEVANETEFATTTEVKAAVDNAITTYNKFLADINAATSITEMQKALQAVADLALEVFEAGEVNEVDENGKIELENAESVFNALEELRNGEKPAQFKTIGEAFGKYAPTF